MSDDDKRNDRLTQTPGKPIERNRLQSNVQRNAPRPARHPPYQTSSWKQSGSLSRSEGNDTDESKNTRQGRVKLSQSTAMQQNDQLR
jgi:hypothetical protein